MTKPYHWRGHLVCATASTLAILAPAPARADFFDGARKTFETDIPHFFQDDIPCAFGGQPTSHTKTSCKSPDKRAPVKAGDRATTPPAAASKNRDPAASSGR